MTGNQPSKDLGIPSKEKKKERKEKPVCLEYSEQGRRNRSEKVSNVSSCRRKSFLLRVRFTLRAVNSRP